MNINNLLRVAAQINLTALPPKVTPGPTAVVKRGQQRKEKKAWPLKKLAEFEIEFVDGFLADHTLRGFTLWRADDERMFVTGPQRSYKVGNEEKYFQFLVGKTRIVREQFADWFIAEYRRVVQQQADPADAAVDEDE